MTTAATHNRIGIYAPISHPFGPPHADDVLGFLTAVDTGGFDSLWVGDHLLWNGTLLESTAVLAAAAALTRHVDIGTNIYLPALRPALLSARNLGTIDHLSGGRLVFGVGLGGENAAEFAAMGLDPRRRRRLFDDSLDQLLAIWRDGRTPEGHAVSPVPAAPRLWIGGRSDAALRRTVNRGAVAWSAHLMSAEQIERSRTRLQDYAQESVAPTPEVAVTLFVDVRGRHDDDGRRFLAAHFGDTSERLLRYVISGDVAQCREQISAYLPMAEHILLFPATDRPWTQLDDLLALTTGLREQGGAAA